MGTLVVMRDAAAFLQERGSERQYLELAVRPLGFMGRREVLNLLSATRSDYRENHSTVANAMVGFQSRLRLTDSRTISDLEFHKVHRDFERGIQSLSKRSSKDNAFPRPDLISLSDFLNNTDYRPVGGSSAASSGTADGLGDNEDCFAVLHDVTSGDSLPFAASSSGMAAFVAHRPSPSTPSILFMRGFPTPRWLTTVGQAYDVSPELYRRHLNFLTFESGRRDFFSSPTLPSSSARVFQLTIPTICTRNISAAGYEPEDLQMARRLEAEAMARYFKQVRTAANPADSVVRKCLLLSKQEYVLEQTVSIEVGPPSDNWRAIVWLDSGKDLSRSVPGPWYPRKGTRPWETYFSPVIVNTSIDGASSLESSQHGFSKPTQNLSADSSHATGDGYASMEQEEWRAAQNICLLPFQYGSSVMDRDLARGDALYSLSGLFVFAASAEVQFLNLLRRRIEHELSFVIAADVATKNHSVSLLNLKYMRAVLASHAQGLAETTGMLRNRRSLDWPRIDGHTVVEKTATLLLADFEYLLQQVHTLERECEQGMATLANSAVLEESRRSVDMAKTVQKLTVIGTVFIPLSFVCSAWGMNFQELGSGKQPMWMFGASLAPAVLFAYMIYNWSFVLWLLHRLRLIEVRN